MIRREFITLIGGAAAWPLAARAQQAAVPVLGYLNLRGSPESDARLTGVRRGLNQSGYVEGRNLLIEYRWAGNQADRLPPRRDTAAPTLRRSVVRQRGAIVMSRRHATITQADIARAIRAAKQAGASEMEVRIAGESAIIIRITPSTAEKIVLEESAEIVL